MSTHIKKYFLLVKATISHAEFVVNILFENEERTPFRLNDEWCKQGQHSENGGSGARIFYDALGLLLPIQGIKFIYNRGVHAVKHQ